MAWEIIAASAGAITAVATAYTKVVRPFLVEEKKRKEELIKKINEIKGELTFNGGSSLKDAVYRVEGNISQLTKRVGSVEENQRAILNLNNIAYWISNNKGECVEASPGLCKLLGRSESEIVGNNWAAWLVSEDKRRVYDAWEHAMNHHITFDEIYSFVKPDGTIIEVWGLAFHKEDGGVFGKLEEIKN
jgi:PAS domain S-box-containing protein